MVTLIARVGNGVNQYYSREDKFPSPTTELPTQFSSRWIVAESYWKAYLMIVMYQQRRRVIQVAVEVSGRMFRSSFEALKTCSKMYENQSNLRTKWQKVSCGKLNRKSIKIGIKSLSVLQCSVMSITTTYITKQHSTYQYCSYRATC